jgi:hypothetical protein
VPWVLLVIFMAKVGTSQNVRHLAAYYVFLFPLLLMGAGQEMLTRKAWWQLAALACMASAVVLLVTNINRPLFPANTLMTRLVASHPNSKPLAMLRVVYSTPAALQGLKRQLQEQMPAGEPVIGYAGVGNLDAEPILWQPWGSRRVEWVLPEDAPEQLLQRGIHYVMIEDYPSVNCRDLQVWMTRYHAHLVADVPFQKGNHHDYSSHIYITRLDAP